MAYITRILFLALFLGCPYTMAAEFIPVAPEADVETRNFISWLEKILNMQKEMAQYHRFDEPVAGIVKYQPEENQSKRNMLRQFTHHLSSWTAQEVGVRFNSEPSHRLFARGIIYEDTYPSIEKSDANRLQVMAEPVLEFLKSDSKLEFYTFWYSGEAGFNFGASGWFILNIENQEILYAGVISSEQ